MKRRSWMTAEELLNKLAGDPEYQARVKERDRRIEEETRKLRAETATLLSELRDVGIDVESVWDLINTSEDYSVVYPILARHLREQYAERNLEGIARSLTRPDALEAAWGALRDRFIENGGKTPEGFGFALGNALGEIMDESVLPDVLELVTERAYGTNREVMVHYLVEYRDRPDVRRVLESLADDPDVAEKAKRALTLRRVRRRPRRGRRKSRT